MGFDSKIEQIAQTDGSEKSIATGFTMTYVSYEETCDNNGENDFYRVVVQGNCNKYDGKPDSAFAAVGGGGKCTSKFEITDPAMCASDYDVWGAMSKVYSILME